MAKAATMTAMTSLCFQPVADQPEGALSRMRVALLDANFRGGGPERMVFRLPGRLQSANEKYRRPVFRRLPLS